MLTLNLSNQIELMVAGYNDNYIRTMHKALLDALEIDVRCAREELKSLV